MLCCTVEIYPQMFRCSLDLSQLWWTRRWSLCPEQSAQVQSQLQISSFVVECELFLCWRPLCVLYVSDLEIVGFIEIADISSPPVISRHLVLPIAVNKGESFFSSF